MKNENINKRNEKIAQEVVKNLKRRNFEAFFCETKENALKKIIEIIQKDETVSWGGSVTLDEIKIKDFLENNNYKIINRDKAKTPEERKELLLKSLTCDVFLMSANAISAEGEIVNIDGHGNRISALCFGPKKVVIVLGVNKITKTLNDAISRARNFAAPINAQRVAGFFKVQTPCLNTGSCCDCKSETSICSHILTTRLCYPKGRICVLIVNENLGF